MHIFIDESGTFSVPIDGRISPSIVGALIVPEHKLDKLFEKYAKLRTRLPQEGGEVKGRKLTESQVAAVVSLLRINSCLFEAVCVEMSLETATECADHKAEQAESITAELTQEHQPKLVEQLWELRNRLETMALPLYVQSVATHRLLHNVLHEIPVYWALRQPKEILNFHWVIDGKGIGQVTSSEDWWSRIMCGLLQTQLASRPMLSVVGANYTEFDKKFSMPMPRYLQETILPYEQGYNLGLLMKESFRFSSAPEYGLELVDIATNATRRALKGNLGPEGWRSIPELMIRRKESSLKLISLSKQAAQSQLPYKSILSGPFSNCGRHMLTKDI